MDCLKKYFKKTFLLIILVVVVIGVGVFFLEINENSLEGEKNLQLTVLSKEAKKETQSKYSLHDLNIKWSNEDKNYNLSMVSVKIMDAN